MGPRLRLRRLPQSGLREQHRKHRAGVRQRRRPRHLVLSQQYSDTVNLGDSGTNPAITPPTDTLRSAPLAEWVAVPQWTLTYTSPDTGGYDLANSQIVAGRITLGMTLTSPAAVPWIEPDMARSNIRFDYAGPVAGKYQGTIFTDARVELQLSLSDPEVDQSARHILDAQQFPERTFPSWPGKTVPGAQEPLHRLTDTAQRDATGIRPSRPARTCGATTLELVWNAMNTPSPVPRSVERITCATQPD